MGGHADDANEKVGQVAEVAQQYLPLNLVGDKVKNLRIPGIKPDGTLGDVGADGTRAPVGEGLNAIGETLEDQAATDDYYTDETDNDDSEMLTQWPDQSNVNSKGLSNQPVALSVVSAAGFAIALTLLSLLFVTRGRCRNMSSREMSASGVV